jgi:hypothetical protein
MTVIACARSRNGSPNRSGANVAKPSDARWGDEDVLHALSFVKAPV